MSKDYQEKRTYRKSPGRQYGYEYDPLRSRSEHSQSGRSNDDSSHRSGQLTPRPDPRRTRQLLRQHILASKTRNLTSDLSSETTDEHYPEMPEEGLYPEERYGVRQTYRGRRAARAFPQDDEDWDGYKEADPGYIEAPAARYEDDLGEEEIVAPVAARSRHLIPTRSRRLAPATDYEDELYEDDEYEEVDVEEYDDEEGKPGKGRKRKVSRRGLLLGIGAAAVVTTGVAAYELAPKLPGAVNNVGSNIERQIQDAFDKGVAQGAENARKEFIIALDSIEGFSLDGAITAARLTRVAYDVFVSPVIKFGSAVTTDFLTGMLNALKTARGWLAGAYQDNVTLQAIQKVLESWVEQVSTMPKQLDSITQADLDGAQAYLRALKRKIDDEKAKLANPQQATPKATAKPSPAPTKKP